MARPDLLDVLPFADVADQDVNALPYGEDESEVRCRHGRATCPACWPPEDEPEPPTRVTCALCSGTGETFGGARICGRCHGRGKVPEAFQ